MDRDDCYKQFYDGGMDDDLEVDDTCCCGCDLKCAVTTFGVLSIPTFIMAIILFIAACTAGTSVA